MTDTDDRTADQRTPGACTCVGFGLTRVHDAHCPAGTGQQPAQPHERVGLSIPRLGIREVQPAQLESGEAVPLPPGVRSVSELAVALRLWGRPDATDHEDSDTRVRRSLCAAAASALTAAQQRIAELTNELNMGELRYVGTDYAKREAGLREALRKYGRHVSGCDSYHNSPLDCDCGLRDALAGKEQGNG